MGSLSFGQWVLIADACHQVPKTRHPGPCFLCIGCYQVQRIHVVAMVNGKAASRIEIPFSMAMEDITLSTFSNLVEWVDGDWEKVHSDKAMSESVHQQTSQMKSKWMWLTSWKKQQVKTIFARWICMNERQWVKVMQEHVSVIKISDSFAEDKQMFGQAQVGIIFSPIILSSSEGNISV